MTDHAESFDEGTLVKYMDECRGLSDSGFCFVPGLEFACEQQMHVLGYGATRLARTKNPHQIIQHIEEQSAISVIAHPKTEHFPWIETFEVLPRGIEAWNSKYDGRYAPRPETFALLQRLRARVPQTLAFYGQDLHWKEQFHRLFVRVNSDRIDPEEILLALSRGTYQGQWDELELPSSGVLPEEIFDRFAKERRKSDRIRAWAKSSKRILDSVGLKIPSSVRSRLRRIF
jgi:hypothetical protein